MRKSLKTTGYALAFALKETFPVTLYGRNWAERLGSLRHSLLACIPTSMLVATVAILIVTASLVGGLYVGSMAALRVYVEDIGLAKTVQLDSTRSDGGELFQQQSLQAFAELASDDRGLIQAVHGWNDAPMWFLRQDGRDDHNFTEGRSVDPEDPLLATLDLLWTPPGRKPLALEDAVEPQLIASIPLLRRLGYDVEAEQYPEALTFKYKNARANIAVVGVCRTTPRGEYLISNRFHRALLDNEHDPDPLAESVLIGPLPVATDTTGLLSKAANYLQGPMVRAVGEKVQHHGETWLAFTREGKPWTETAWEERFVDTVVAELGLEPGSLTHEFPNHSRASSTQRISQPLRFARASIYVGQLEDVPLVVDTLQAQGHAAPGDAKELALLFLRLRSYGGKLLFGILGIVASLASINVFLSFFQAIQRKAPEVGILKAFGAGHSLILLVYLASACFIWLMSFAGGVSVAGLLARLANTRIQDLLKLRGITGLESLDLVDVSAVITPVALGSLMLCVLATLWASYKAVRILPAEALRGLR